MKFKSVGLSLIMMLILSVATAMAADVPWGTSQLPGGGKVTVINWNSGEGSLNNRPEMVAYGVLMTVEQNWQAPTNYLNVKARLELENGIIVESFSYVRVTKYYPYEIVILQTPAKVKRVLNVEFIETNHVLNYSIVPTS